MGGGMVRRTARIVHLVLGAALIVTIYAPTRWTEALRLGLATIGVPLLVATGVTLWQQAWLRRTLGRVELLALLTGSAGLAAVGQVLVQRTFAEVRHPVTLAEANLTFDAATVRGHYQVLVAQGTLPRMVATELVDFIWSVGLASSLIMIVLTVAALLRHRNPAGSRRLRRMAPLMALAPACDVVENSVSLMMLSDPFGFPEVLAPLHAGFSVAKLTLAAASATLAPAYAVVAAAMGPNPWGLAQPTRRVNDGRDGEVVVSPRSA
ncbi:hypothetical protein [Pseudonocardia sp. TRM90224]|uniref:hypothetical protein n=1 Tax=Pseudonocardia sp. TRM90224 TaxID=2812678 RepID=UPI001E4160CE|nr:hypothetical protein [Pseudonocardia sp. TRM90224]